MPLRRFRCRVKLREGASAAELLSAIRGYALEKAGKPWGAASKRPLVLRHSSPKAAGATYELSREGDHVAIVVRTTTYLALSYLVTLLASPRFTELVAGVELDLS